MNIEKIKAREQAATPGPWMIGDGSEKAFMAGKNAVVAPLRVVVDRATYPESILFNQQTYDDIDFIAHARTDIPALIAEVERLEKIVKLQKASCSLVETVEAGKTADENNALKKENATLKKALEEITRIKNDYFSQLQSYIKAFRLHQAALELMCSDLLSAYACPINPENIDLYTKKYIQQAQQTHETQEAEK